MARTIVEFIFSTFLVGMLVYGPAAFFTFLIFNLKYPKMFKSTNKRTRLGFHMVLDDKYSFTEQRIEKIVTKILPSISFSIGFIYSLFKIVF